MEPRIITTEAFKLAGIHQDMCMADDNTVKLWTRFMPLKMKHPQLRERDNYSVKVHRNLSDLKSFTPQTMFTKWAAVNLKEATNFPELFDILDIPAGSYAVFIHKGPAETFNQTMSYIFTQWLPKSAFVLRDAPHFEVLKNNYNPNDPLAEEAVWIPIQEKK